MNIFKNYRESIIIKDHVKAKHIIVGDYSYYSGYYHDKPFEDCVMYLDEADDHRLPHETDRLIIGKFCSIATGVKFMMGGTQGHNYEWIANYPLDLFDEDFDGYNKVPPKAHKRKGDTVIGNDVWIGAETMIMPGINISDGAVIGARSLVTKNIGPYEIWGGNPAKLIKKRFSDEEIEKLLEIKWWDFSIEQIKANLHLIRSNKIDELWNKFRITESSILPKSIEALERSLLDSSVRQSTEQLNKLIADDFLEFGSSGKIYNKQDCIKPDECPRKFVVSDFKIKELSKDVMLATYKTTEDGIDSLRSSIWQRYGDEWKMIFHQGTKCEVEDEHEE